MGASRLNARPTMVVISAVWGLVGAIPVIGAQASVSWRETCPKIAVEEKASLILLWILATWLSGCLASLPFMLGMGSALRKPYFDKHGNRKPVSGTARMLWVLGAFAAIAVANTVAVIFVAMPNDIAWLTTGCGAFGDDTGAAFEFMFLLPLAVVIAIAALVTIGQLYAGLVKRKKV